MIFFSSSAARRVTASPTVRVTVVALLLFTFALHYASSHFFRDPGSAFYDPQRAYDRAYSAHRELETDDSLLSAEHGEHARIEAPESSVQKHPEICTVIVTIKRDVHRPYVYTTAGSLLANLTVAERETMWLSLQFADVDPESNSVSSQTWFRELFDNVHTYDDSEVSKEEQTYLGTLEGVEGLQKKGALDYALALQYCMNNTHSPYIAVFEDDVIMADSWLPRVLLSAREGASLMQRTAGDSSRWLYLRLFTQERSTGWASKDIGGNNEGLISLGVSAALLTPLLLARRYSPMLRAALPAGALAVMCLLVVPSFIVLFFQCGKASVLPPRSGVREEDFGCCSQSLVYNRQHVPALINFLRDGERPIHPYDVATQGFAEAHGLKQLSVYPMMAQHVGTKSASGNRDTGGVWSMAFENLKAPRLYAEHMAMAEKCFGQ